ncbi:MAG: TauD/TfdA family dioxygenase [Magnetospirillum sp. WYHS-4]
MAGTTVAEAAPPGAGGPFDLEAPEAYARWREWKLAAAPRAAGELVVEIKDPFDIDAVEHAALLDRLQRANMALFVAPPVDAETGKRLIREVGTRFGLERLDANMLADDDGITPLTVIGEGRRTNYIPYTNRPIKWHTDGYYNTLDRQDRSLLLYCVSDSQTGGENALMDHEIAYILLRDTDPEHIRALMHPHAMTIPANTEGGEEIRVARTGPVFLVDPENGSLHMRYTARKRNIVWRDDAATRAAVAALEAILDADSPYVFRHRMAPGQGLVSNNVLHDRAGFEDGPEGGKKRLIYRARYFDRLSGTGLRDVWRG